MPLIFVKQLKLVISPTDATSTEFSTDLFSYCHVQNVFDSVVTVLMKKESTLYRDALHLT